MAGLGSRFLTKCYDIPKPLIDINGTPMIIKAIQSLGIQDANYFFVISKNKHSHYIKEQISQYVKSSFIEIDYITEGPACSCLLFKNSINNNEELIIANCDQIMEWNHRIFLLNVRQYDGAMVTYHETTEKNSYAAIDHCGYVKEVREKKVISNISLNGVHYWKQGCTFVDSAEEMINNDDRADNGEFYVGPTYNYMIKQGYRVGIYHIPNQMHHPVGVPEDLERYVEYEKSKN